MAKTLIVKPIYIDCDCGYRIAPIDATGKNRKPEAYISGIFINTDGGQLITSWHCPVCGKFGDSSLSLNELMVLYEKHQLKKKKKGNGRFN